MAFDSFFFKATVAFNSSIEFNFVCLGGLFKDQTKRDKLVLFVFVDTKVCSEN